MPGFDLDDMFAAQRTAVNALVSVGNTALLSAERMAALNLHAVREVMVDFAQGTQRMFEVQNAQDAVTLPHHLAKPHIEKGVRYSRSLAEISAVAQEDAVQLIEAQYTGFMSSMTELANQIAQATPMGGSEVAVAAIRSTMRSTSEAFERFNAAVERFTEVAEESVSTMANATVTATTGQRTPKVPPKVPARRK